ncbi:MAG: SpoIIE family protein phosphatase [Prevotella sp.]|nr:SpoIIE family protein phosphatase [Prevotella sp.]
MNKLFDKWRKSFQTKSTLIIIFTAAVLIETTSLVQYFYAREGIREGVQQRAESELAVRNLKINNVMNAVEVAVQNMAWIVELSLDRPDTMYAVTRKMLACNDIIVGSAVAFEPNYYPQKGRQFSPYSYKTADGTIHSKQLGTDSYDYHRMEWYTVPFQNDRPHWSEPYYDEGGGEMMMSTYSMPIHDAEGRTVGIFTADVSLDWLSGVINTNPIYPSSYNLLISRAGQIMACPVESLVLNSNIQDINKRVEDTTVNYINRQILSGNSGQASVINEQGEKDYVFYSPVEGGTGWSMVVVCSDSDVYGGLRRVSINLFLLMLVGLALLTYILFRTVRGYKRLQEVNAEKERIGSELHIASAIQMGMLPKIFPPYPERDDVEIFATLVPAKEVGGDLYDFYIRDEKLFFCIGDVSGKGVPASLVMAVTRSLFRTVSAHEASPSRILTLMNDSMADMNQTNMFVTLFVGVLDLPTGRLHYSNAGHEAPLLVGDGMGSLPIDSNIPIGIMTDWKFTGQDTFILPQTCIFLYTDGLTEAEAIDHEQFGKQRVLDTARELYIKKECTTEMLINNMTEAVHTFVDEAEQSDDLTMLAIQYTKQELAVRLKRNITLANDVQEIPQLASFVDEVCEELEISAAETMQLNLALEEAVVNVMNYAYPAGTKGMVEIEAQANDVRLKFVITDSGSPFDPTAREEVDTTLSAEERPIGGLGIHLVRQLMDSINYERLDGKNVLTLRKSLK